MAPRQSPSRYRPVTTLDLAAGALAKVASSRLTPAIEQARRDAHGVLDGFWGRNERSYRSEQHPMRAPRPLHEISLVEECLPPAARKRYQALRRDLDVIVRGFQGQHPPPFFQHRPQALAREQRSIATAQPSTTRRMRIAAVVRETADVVTLRLEDVGGAKVAFEAGQFLSVRADVNGETLWRAYSICTAPSSGELAISVKRVEGGRVSSQLNATAKVGDVLEVRGPSGRFTLARSVTPRHVVLLGGGSGITPLMSHVHNLLESEAQTRVTLLYGNRGERDIIFKATLDALARRHPRFTVRHVLSQPADTFECGVGMLDRATTLRELAQLALEDGESTQYLICGPEPMMKAAREAVLERGVAVARILEERFTGPVVSDSTRAGSYQEQLVTIKLGAKETQVKVQPGLTLLEAALSADVQLDFSCTMGGCGACVVKLVEGTVHMDEPSCLSASERAEGKILTCIARPTSACRLSVEKV